MGQCTACCGSNGIGGGGGSSSSSTIPQKMVLERERRVISHKGPATADYEIVPGAAGILHRGIHAIVYKAQHKASGTWRAVKQVKKEDKIKAAMWHREVEVHKQMDHPHICRLFETYEDDKDLSQVLEMCLGRNLTSLASCDQALLTEAFSAVLTRQMLSAIGHLHEKQISHTDLRPESFIFTKPFQAKGHMLCDLCLKLIDFGLASATLKTVNDSSAGGGKLTKTGFTATKVSWAPERFALESEYHQDAEVYGAPLDIWSVGAISFFLICGSWPQVEPNAHISSKFKSAPLEPVNSWKGVSAEGKDFVSKCLTVEAKDRPTAENLLPSKWMGLAQQAYQGSLDERGAAANAAAKNPKAKKSILDNPLLGAKDILGSFRSMAQMSDLERAAITAVAHNLPEEKVAHLRTAFQQLDVNGDGVLTAEELKKGLKTGGLGSMLSGGDEMSKLLALIDTDGSGKIEYTEFLAATYAFRKNLRDEVSDAAFRMFDEDQSGTISIDEVSKMLHLQDGGKNSEAEQMLKQIDQDGNGEIDKEEFRMLLKGNVATSTPTTAEGKRPSATVSKAGSLRSSVASQQSSTREDQDGSKEYSSENTGGDPAAPVQAGPPKRRNSFSMVGDSLKGLISKAGQNSSEDESGSRSKGLSRKGSITGMVTGLLKKRPSTGDAEGLGDSQELAVTPKKSEGKEKNGAKPKKKPSKAK